MDLELVLRDGPGDVPRARHPVSTELRDQDVRVDLDTVELVLTELVTNAIVHGATPVTVRVADVDDGVRIEVTDGDPADLPHRIGAGPRSEHGRGLLLVEALTEAWGVRPGPARKTVWAEIDGARPATDGAQPAGSRGLRAPNGRSRSWPGSARSVSSSSSATR